MAISSYISPKAVKGQSSAIEGRGLTAAAPIAAGEELTTDYALFDDYDGEMECRCGTASCRGVISGRDWQRPELRQRYGDYFSWYLRCRFDSHG